MAKARKCRHCGTEFTMVGQPQGPPIRYCCSECPGPYQGKRRQMGLKKIFHVFDQLQPGEVIKVTKFEDGTTIHFAVHNDHHEQIVTADPTDREDIGNTCQRLEQGLRKIRGEGGDVEEVKAPDQLTTEMIKDSEAADAAGIPLELVELDGLTPVNDMRLENARLKCELREAREVATEYRDQGHADSDGKHAGGGTAAEEWPLPWDEDKAMPDSPEPQLTIDELVNNFTHDPRARLVIEGVAGFPKVTLELQNHISGWLQRHTVSGGDLYMLLTRLNDWAQARQEQD